VHAKFSEPVVVPLFVAIDLLRGSLQSTWVMSHSRGTQAVGESVSACLKSAAASAYPVRRESAGLTKIRMSDENCDPSRPGIRVGGEKFVTSSPRVWRAAPVPGRSTASFT